MQPYHCLYTDLQQLVIEQERNLFSILVYVGVPLPVKDLDYNPVWSQAPLLWLWQLL